jgi:hypothetical protein
MCKTTKLKAIIPLSEYNDWLKTGENVEKREILFDKTTIIKEYDCWYANSKKFAEDYILIESTYANITFKALQDISPYFDTFMDIIYNYENCKNPMECIIIDLDGTIHKWKGNDAKDLFILVPAELAFNDNVKLNTEDNE